MSELLLFFVSFEIKEGHGQVENRIQYASINVIGDKAKYKFRFLKNGFCNVTCTSLTHLESWQKLLGSSSSQYNFPHRLSGNDFLWFEVGYDHGISKDEFDILWERGTQSMIHQLREGQIEIEIFKVLGERRLYGFTSKKSYEDWETHLWNFQAEDKIYKNAKLVTKI
ncbi:unnamed protein product [Mytilus coruscus]|uniref:Uncharacterized protein n=1 Tax=Mytilus coruscus TaxID=42192 RepID=A0A6J8ESA3_MYTCO|nr:unnamed protein product [Mytilus coruscus]